MPRILFVSDGVLRFSPLEFRLNLHSLEGLSLHPQYRVSPSKSISALCLYIWTPHTASTSSQAAIRLWGVSGTLNAFLAALGIFFNINSSISVVTIAAFFGVPRILFISCSSDILKCVPCPISEYDAAESKKAVVLIGLGGLVQPGRLSSLKIIISRWFALSFSIWSVAKACVCGAASHSVLPRCFLHVIGVSFSILKVLLS